MKTPLRLAFLVVLTASTSAVIWVVGRRPAPAQPLTLRPVLDRATEAKAAVDRVGQEVFKVSDGDETYLGNCLWDQIRRQTWGSEPNNGTRDAFWLHLVMQRLVARGGLRRPLARYQVGVLESPVANAFALPGGHIFVTRGMLALLHSEAEAAALLGHEMAHVDLRHCIERYQYELQARKVGGPPLAAMASLGTQFMLQGYRDDQEAEADRWGMQLAAHAGYHPQAAQTLLARLQGRPGAMPRTLPAEALQAAQDALEDYFASHPSGEQRLALLNRAMEEAGLDPAITEYYVGVRNRNELWTREEREFPEELVRRRIF